MFRITNYKIFRELKKLILIVSSQHECFERAGIIFGGKNRPGSLFGPLALAEGQALRPATDRVRRLSLSPFLLLLLLCPLRSPIASCFPYAHDATFERNPPPGIGTRKSSMCPVPLGVVQNHGRLLINPETRRKRAWRMSWLSFQQAFWFFLFNRNLAISLS